jgi:succinoglycan biosynthesis transport protein ExoP
MHCAMTGRSTLLIDADLRRRALSHELGIAEHPGLSDILTGAAPPAAAIVCDQTCGLYVLGSGTAAAGDARAAGILTGSRLPSLLDWLRGSFDVIVIDSPPLMPVVDGRLLGANADQILLVAAWRSTPVSLLRRSINSLGIDAGRIAGIVLNRMDPSIHREVVGSYSDQARIPAQLALPYAKAA